MFCASAVYPAGIDDFDYLATQHAQLFARLLGEPASGWRSIAGCHPRVPHRRRSSGPLTSGSHPVRSWVLPLSSMARQTAATSRDLVTSSQFGAGRMSSEDVRTLYVVRHALTSKGSERRRASHLSVEGVRQARAMGASLPQMFYVVVGDQARHLETAIAMGYAVDEQVSWPSGDVEGEVAHHDQWTWDQPFARYAELLSNGGRLREVAEERLGHWRRILTHVPDGGSALIVFAQPAGGASGERCLIESGRGSERRWPARGSWQERPCCGTRGGRERARRSPR
jgi:hypothetical protein